MPVTGPSTPATGDTELQSGRVHDADIVTHRIISFPELCCKGAHEKLWNPSPRSIRHSVVECRVSYNQGLTRETEILTNGGFSLGFSHCKLRLRQTYWGCKKHTGRWKWTLRGEGLASVPVAASVLGSKQAENAGSARPSEAEAWKLTLSLRTSARASVAQSKDSQLAPIGLLKLRLCLKEDSGFNGLISRFKEKEGNTRLYARRGLLMGHVHRRDSRGSSSGTTGVIIVTRSSTASTLHPAAARRGIRTQIPAGKIIKHPNQIVTVNKQFNST